MGRLKPDLQPFFNHRRYSSLGIAFGVMSMIGFSSRAARSGGAAFSRSTNTI
jgi:hypothetical protein